MGHMTNYELETDDSSQEDHEEKISYIIDFDIFEYDCKWYGHQRDMKAYSKKHPKVLFILHGEGEGAGDLWIKYFKNGKMQVCKAKITYADYDEELLK